LLNAGLGRILHTSYNDIYQLVNTTYQLLLSMTNINYSKQWKISTNIYIEKYQLLHTMENI